MLAFLSSITRVSGVMVRSHYRGTLLLSAVNMRSMDWIEHRLLVSRDNELPAIFQL